MCVLKKDYKDDTLTKVEKPENNKNVPREILSIKRKLNG